MALLHLSQSPHVLLMRSILILDLGLHIESLPLFMQHLARLLPRKVYIRHHSPFPTLLRRLLPMFLREQRAAREFSERSSFPLRGGRFILAFLLRSTRPRPLRRLLRLLVGLLALRLVLRQFSLLGLLFVPRLRRLVRVLPRLRNHREHPRPRHLCIPRLTLRYLDAPAATPRNDPP